LKPETWTFKADGSLKSSFGERVDLMSSVSYWYQAGIAQGLPPVPYGPLVLRAWEHVRVTPRV
jgi:hypothetical protein